MGELLGIGLSHAPMFQFPDENMADILRSYLTRESIPAERRAIENWPREMRQEWGDDEGLSAARAHRELVVSAFRKLRTAVDEFQPDFVLIWGDDQYENFKEDVVPPFCVYLYDQLDCLPYQASKVIKTPRNVWDQPVDKVVPVRGHREAASYLVRELTLDQFDVAYAYKPHHHPTLAHAFMRTIMFLDYDQRGFDYPVIPFHVNCYGSDLMNRQEVQENTGPVTIAPPAPTPRRCYDLGRAVGRILGDSPWRAVVIGSSSWSHAFLTKKHYGLYPDVESDRQRLAELQSGRHTEWRNLDLATITGAGQHEFLNWICLAGAMADRQAEVLAFAESWIFNSDKVAAIFRP